MRERTFTRGGVTVTTSTPSAATQLLGDGWSEIHDWPTERPKPADRFERPDGSRRDFDSTLAVNATGTDEPVVESRSARRRKAVSDTGEMPPTDTTE